MSGPVGDDLGVSTWPPMPEGGGYAKWAGLDCVIVDWSTTAGNKVKHRELSARTEQYYGCWGHDKRSAHFSLRARPTRAGARIDSASAPWDTGATIPYAGDAELSSRVATWREHCARSVPQRRWTRVSREHPDCRSIETGLRQIATGDMFEILHASRFLAPAGRELWRRPTSSTRSPAGWGASTVSPRRLPFSTPSRAGTSGSCSTRTSSGPRTSRRSSTRPGSLLAGTR